MRTIAEHLFLDFENEHTTAREMRSARKSNRRIYEYTDHPGKTVLLGAGAAHFKPNGTDEWQDIDLSFDATVDAGDNGWKIRSASYKLFVPNNKIGFRYQAKNGARVDYILVKWNNQLLADVEPVNYTAEIETTPEFTRFIWRDVKPGLDIALQVKPNGVEFFKILNNEAAADSLEWRVRWDNNFEGSIQMDAQGESTQPLNDKHLKYRVDSQNTKENITTFPGRIMVRRREIFRKQVRKFHPITKVPFWSDAAFVGYPVLIDTELIEDVTAAADDGYDLGGSINFTTAPVWVSWSQYGTHPIVQRVAGARWSAVPLPTGKTLDTATVTLNVFKLVSTTGCNTQFYFEDTDDPGGFGQNDVPNRRTKTTAFTSYDLNSIAAHDINVLGAVNEVYARTGWASNNAMICLMWPNDTTGTGTRSHSVKSRPYEFGSLMPRLKIEWDLPSEELVVVRTSKMTAMGGIQQPW